MKQAGWMAGLLTLMALGTAHADETVHVTLKDNQILVDQPSVKAGKVTFVIQNQGSMIHELVVLKTDVAEDQLPIDKKGDKAVEGKANKGEVEDIKVGKTKSKTMKLAAGKYILICNMPGHYALGMHAALTLN